MYYTALCSPSVSLPKVLNHHLLLFGVFSHTNNELMFKQELQLPWAAEIHSEIADDTDLPITAVNKACGLFLSRINTLQYHRESYSTLTTHVLMYMS